MFDIMMIITDLAVLSLSLVYMITIGPYLKNYSVDPDDDPVVTVHKQEHFRTMLTSFIGSMFMFAFSGLHFIGQDIIGVSTADLDFIEMFRNISLCIFGAGALMYGFHAVREETEGDPYYIRGD